MSAVLSTEFIWSPQEAALACQRFLAQKRPLKFARIVFTILVCALILLMGLKATSEGLGAWETLYATVLLVWLFYRKPLFRQFLVRRLRKNPWTTQSVALRLSPEAMTLTAPSGRSFRYPLTDAFRLEPSHNGYILLTGQDFWFLPTQAFEAPEAQAWFSAHLQPRLGVK